jgi:hypothetical protein
MIKNIKGAVLGRIELRTYEHAYKFNMEKGYYKIADKLIEKMIDSAWEIPSVQSNLKTCGILYADFDGLFRDSLEQTKGKLIKDLLFPIWWLVDNAPENLYHLKMIGQEIRNGNINNYRDNVYRYTDTAIKAVENLFTSYPISEVEYISDQRAKYNKLEKILLNTNGIFGKIDVIEKMAEEIWEDSEKRTIYKDIGLNKKQFKFMLTEWMISDQNIFIEKLDKFLTTIILIDDPEKHDIALKAYLFGFGSTNAPDDEIMRNIRHGSNQALKIIKERLQLQSEA